MQKPPTSGGHAEVNIIKNSDNKNNGSNENKIKTYDFTNKIKDFGRVVFALTLDKKKLAERIIIGRADEVRRLLNGGDGEVYYDEVRPLGSLLLSFESDMGGDWNSIIMPLRDSYKKISLIGNARWKMVEPVQKFLTDKYNSGEPSAIYAAILSWEEYLRFHNQNHGATLLNDSLFMLYKPFRVYKQYKPWHEKATAALSVALQNNETTAELWYLGHTSEQFGNRTAKQANKHPFEVAVISSSFLPLIFYYTQKISEWGYVFRQCKICDAFFLARSNHFDLCSDECRRKQAAVRKQEHEERYKDDKATPVYETAYYYWYNRLKKLRKGKLANPDHEAIFRAELKKFCDEGKRLKKLVQRGKMKFDDFNTWLAQQANLADDLMDKFTQ